MGDEARFVWGQSLSAATVLFMLNRYVNLLITVLELIEQASFQTAKVSYFSDTLNLTNVPSEVL